MDESLPPKMGSVYVDSPLTCVDISITYVDIPLDIVSEIFEVVYILLIANY